MTRPTVTVAEQAVDAVAAEMDADPLDLPPLYDAIDPDALNAWIRASSDGEVSFSYAGVSVVIDSEGSIQVADTRTTASAERFEAGADD